MDTGNQFLGTERIGALMRRYAVPCIISLLVGALFFIRQTYRELSDTNTGTLKGEIE